MYVYHKTMWRTCIVVLPVLKKKLRYKIGPIYLRSNIHYSALHILLFIVYISLYIEHLHNLWLKRNRNLINLLQPMNRLIRIRKITHFK